MSVELSNCTPTVVPTVSDTRSNIELHIASTGLW